MRASSSRGTVVPVGFDIHRDPQGAFYVYAGCSRLTGDSFEFSRRLLEEAGVAITPGVDFGAHRARDHVRFAYTIEMAKLEDGVSRLARFHDGRRAVRA